MVDFALDPELELLQETARGFADDHLRPHDRDSERERRVSEPVQATFREIGLAGLELPEALGGAGLGALARSIVLEELAAADAGATLALDPFGPALYPILELADGDEQSRLLHPLLEEPGARALLVWDDSGSFLAGGERVTGSTHWVPADRADLVVILGREGARVVSEGTRLESLRGAGLRAAGASTLHFEDAPVVASWTDREAAARSLARARLYLTSLLLGTMRASADHSRGYAQERVAFGRPIAHHQALAFLIADMAAAVEGTRWLLREAAWRVDAGEEAREACATAFLEAAEQALFVTPNGLQILGGHGFMQDYPVEKYMREARALGLLLGGVDAAKEEAGRELAATAGSVPLSAGS